MKIILLTLCLCICSILMPALGDEVDGYEIKEGKYCDAFGSMKFSTFTDAKSACEQDSECHGFFHNCGSKEFRLCDGPILEKTSSCGSIMYRKDPCLNNACNGNTCTPDLAGGITCDCSTTGFTGDTCDSDPCLNNVCNGNTCTPDMAGGITCDCSKTGFTGDTCDTDPCDVCNGNTCTLDLAGGITCDCSTTGFTGDTCDTDPCLNDACNGNMCTPDFAGGITCDCSKTGFTGDTCDTNCLEKGFAYPGFDIDTNGDEIPENKKRKYVKNFKGTALECQKLCQATTDGKCKFFTYIEKTERQEAKCFLKTSNEGKKGGKGKTSGPAFCNQDK